MDFLKKLWQKVLDFSADTAQAAGNAVLSSDAIQGLIAKIEHGILETILFLALAIAIMALCKVLWGLCKRMEVTIPFVGFILAIGIAGFIYKGMSFLGVHLFDEYVLPGLLAFLFIAYKAMSAGVAGPYKRILKEIRILKEENKKLKLLLEQQQEQMKVLLDGANAATELRNALRKKQPQ